MKDLPSPSVVAQPKTQDSIKPVGWHHTVKAPLLLVLVTVMVYLPALRCGYIWDDNYYVTANDTLRDVDGLVRIWTEPGAVPQYYPLVHSVFWAQYQLFELNPVSYHAVNLLCHVLVSLLWWRVLKRLSVPGSFLAALIFAVHPIQVESVVWVTELKNVLSGMFYLLTTMAYLRFAGVSESRLSQKQSPTRWFWYAIALVCFMSALLSKTVVCTLPAALVLVMWWKRRAFPWRDVVCLIPLFVLGLAMGLHTAAMEKNHVGAQGADWAFDLTDRVLISGRVLWFYAGKILWPAKIVFFYDYWHIDPSQTWQWLLPIGVLLVIYTLLRNRHLITGQPLVAILFFAGSLFPALGFVNVFPMRYSFVADHFQYLAGMGIIALVSGVLWYGLRHVRHVRMALSVLIVITLGVRTTNHIPVYTNEKTLWEHVITNNCAPWMALNNLGVIYRDTGKGDIAQTYFKQAIVHRPNEYSIYNNLGMAYRDKKQYDLAANVLEHALPLETRGVTLYASLARVRELQGHPHQAIKLLGKATALQKGRADLWLNMGIIQMQQHLWQEAQDAIQTTLKLDPHNLNAWLALSKINKTISTPESVIDTYHQALTFLPDNTTLHNDLALLAATMGDSDLAIKHWKIAIALEPDNSMCTLNLGTLYLKRKQWDQARLWLSRTHELPLHSPSVLPKLALCLLNDPNANSADWQLAREYMLTFKQFTPPLSPADQQLLATACEAAGDYQSAINVLLPLIESLSTSTTDDLQLLQQLKAQLERCQNTLK